MARMGDVGPARPASWASPVIEELRHGVSVAVGAAVVALVVVL